MPFLSSAGFSGLHDKESLPRITRLRQGFRRRSRSYGGQDGVVFASLREVRGLPSVLSDGLSDVALAKSEAPTGPEPCRRSEAEGAKSEAQAKRRAKEGQRTDDRRQRTEIRNQRAMRRVTGLADGDVPPDFWLLSLGSFLSHSCATCPPQLARRRRIPVRLRPYAST